MNRRGFLSVIGVGLVGGLAYTAGAIFPPVPAAAPVQAPPKIVLPNVLGADIPMEIAEGDRSFQIHELLADGDRVYAIYSDGSKSVIIKVYEVPR